MASGPYADHFLLPCLNVSDDRHMEYARTKLIVPTIGMDRFSRRGSQKECGRAFPGLQMLRPSRYVHFCTFLRNQSRASA